MAITFDEALNELEPRTIWSSEMRDLLEQLRAEYAPTIEMTECEKDTLLKYVFGDNGNFFDLVEYETDYLYKKLSPSELMQAWLHPEMVKVVDDERN